jgi:thioredoxin-related protein
MSDDRRSDAVVRFGRTGSANPRFDRRWVVGGLITFAASGALNSPAIAATHSLIMIEDDGCVYCVRWHKEVGQAYDRSAEGRFAPLDRRKMRDPDIAFLRNVRYTPTFVLVRGEEEIGRITGYPGADFFWQLLAELLAKAGFNDAPSAAPVDDIKT